MAGWLLLIALGLLLALSPAAAAAQPGVSLPQTAEQERLNAQGERLNQQARAAYDAGDYPRALELADQSRAIFERLFGPDDVGVAAALQLTGLIAMTRGDYPVAEPALLREVAILERALGPDHQAVAHALDVLSSLYFRKGDFRRTIRIAERAVAIVERRLGPEHARLAPLLAAIALSHNRLGERERAARLMRRAVALREAQLGPEHPTMGTALANLSVIVYDEGRFDEAIALLERSLAISEKAYGATHPNLVLPLNNLALQLARGRDLKRAEGLYLRALAIHDASTPEHPQRADLLENLSALMRRMGELERALDFQARANEARERYVARVLTVGNEHERRMLLSEARSRADGPVSLHTRAMPDDPRALRLALTAVLRTKGRLFDATAGTFAALRRRMAPADAQLLDALAGTRARLAHATFSGAGRERLASLIGEHDTVERQLSARSALFRAEDEPVTLDAVRAAIPEGAALLEIVRYQPFSDADDETLPALRYAGYVVRRADELAWADLGEAQAIEALVEELRAALARPDTDPRPAARALDARVTAPLRALAGRGTQLIIAADGALQLVPFGAFVEEGGSYLAASVDISYLTTGRDLLRLAARTPPRSPALVMASPDFGPVAPSATSPARGGLDLRGVVFPPLPATEAEGRAVAALLDGVRLLRGADATEAALKTARAPALLHVATHGFFFAPPSDAPGARADATRGLELVETDGDDFPVHPMFRSGLALAGANAVGQHAEGEAEDGVLTAYEAASLDLWGTELVVLSACETAVGGLHSQDGVYGLRRAFLIAGAESLVMSLWKVDDDATADLMISYHRRLRAGGGRAASLHAAQRALLADPRRQHPYYWASFIAMGDWRPLRSARPDQPSAGTHALRVPPGGGCGCRAGATDRHAPWAVLALGALCAVARRRRTHAAPICRRFGLRARRTAGTTRRWRPVGLRPCSW